MDLNKMIGEQAVSVVATAASRVVSFMFLVVLESVVLDAKSKPAFATVAMN